MVNDDSVNISLRTAQGIGLPQLRTLTGCIRVQGRIQLDVLAPDRRLIPLSQMALDVVCGLCRVAVRGVGDGARNGQGPIAFAVSRDVSRRDELRRLFVGAALVEGFCLSRLWRATRRGAEEPGVHIRMPRLRSTDFGHGGNCDASFQAAADDVVLGGASHGDTFQRHVGAAIGGSTRRHLQDRLAADAEACAGRWSTRIAIPWRASSRSIRRKFPSAKATPFSSAAMPAKSSSSALLK